MEELASLDDRRPAPAVAPVGIAVRVDRGEYGARVAVPEEQVEPAAIQQLAFERGEVASHMALS